MVREHLEAFNAHDRHRLLATLHDDVVWATGRDVLHGRAAVGDLFDDWLWSHDPRIDVTTMVIEGDTAAVECVEAMVVDGGPARFSIAIFFTLREDLLAQVKVYREGSADLPG